MARLDYWQYLLDRNGNPLERTQVRVYLAGTLTEANIYLDSSFGSVTTSSEENLKTDEFGFIQFWIGDIHEIEGGYNVDQQFKIVWQNTVDGIQEEIDNFYIFAPVRTITTDDSIKGIPSNKDLDKVISNKQGYKWEAHVDSVVPSASPHGLEAVVWFDKAYLKNKVISNKLGYQMYKMAQSASTTSTDVSASKYFNQPVLSLTPSAGSFYTEVTHNLNNRYPIVKVTKLKNYRIIKPSKIESVNINTTRIWMNSNIKIRTTFFG